MEEKIVVSMSSIPRISNKLRIVTLINQTHRIQQRVKSKKHKIGLPSQLGQS